MRFGRVEFRRDSVPEAEDPSLYADRLAELASILSGMPWMLAGGLTVPMTLGGFYRRHYDVDIAFPVESFPHIEQAMARAGYALTTYFPLSFFGAHRCALHIPLCCTSTLARWRTRKLKFRDATGKRRPPNLLAVVEALPFRVEGDVLVTCDGRHRLNLDRPLVGGKVLTDAGHEISCLDLHYVARLKKGKRELKHFLDLAMIRDERPQVAHAGD